MVKSILNLTLARQLAQGIKEGRQDIIDYVTTIDGELSDLVVLACLGVI